MRAILGLGSNVPIGDKKIEQAIDCLTEKGLKILSRSGIYHVSGLYVNEVVAVETMLDYAELSAVCKDIEIQLGRNAETRAAAIVPIDIDPVIFDGQVTRTRDYNEEYFQVGYRKILKP